MLVVSAILPHYYDLSVLYAQQTVNTEGEYRCIIVGHNNPVRVDKKKGYEAICWLGFFMSAFRVESIYPGLNCGSSQKLLLLELQLILVAAQYIVYSGSEF